MKKKKNQKSAFFGSAFLVNSVKESDDKKIDGYGLISAFYSWGYPCDRSWVLLFSLFDLQVGMTSVKISIRHKRELAKRKVMTIHVDVSAEGSTTIHYPLAYRFDKAGRYFIICEIEGSSKKIIVPFDVITKEWPEFSQKEINFGKDSQFIPHSLKANVNCSGCKEAYIFEESFLPDFEPGPGALSFPKLGEKECSNCGQLLFLKDIQGQIRASLKKLITEKMGGK